MAVAAAIVVVVQVWVWFKCGSCRVKTVNLGLVSGSGQPSQHSELTGQRCSVLVNIRFSSIQFLYDP
ncbi:hypothetical protein HanRHA438_Chr15g0710721 [Helianthus annuus]|nr:hypothetical protein HanRHA438_Chr15g0710721 [Helianthus annuus]